MIHCSVTTPRPGRLASRGAREESNVSSARLLVQPSLWEADSARDRGAAAGHAEPQGTVSPLGGTLPEDKAGLEALTQTLYAELNRRHFDGILPPCTIAFSDRMTRTAGWVRYRDLRMQLSIPYVRRYGYEELINTLTHEMIHVWLSVRGRPRGHTKEFRAKLVACGLENRIHALPMPPKGARYLYVCPGCHRERYARRKLRSSCGHCDRVYNPKFRFQLRAVLDGSSPRRRAS